MQWKASNLPIIRFLFHQRRSRGNNSHLATQDKGEITQVKVNCIAWRHCAKNLSTLQWSKKCALGVSVQQKGANVFREVQWIHTVILRKQKSPLLYWIHGTVLLWRTTKLNYENFNLTWRQKKYILHRKLHWMKRKLTRSAISCIKGSN